MCEVKGASMILITVATSWLKEHILPFKTCRYVDEDGDKVNSMVCLAAADNIVIQASICRFMPTGCKYEGGHGSFINPINVWPNLDPTTVQMSESTSVQAQVYNWIFVEASWQCW